jgi:O-antigen ligase
MHSAIFKLNWQVLFLTAIAALLPFGISCWPVAYLWLFLWFYSGEYKKFKLHKDIWFWALCGFFILHVAGYYYSNDKVIAYGIAVEMAGFAILPIVLSTYALTKAEFREILRIFCLSNVFLAAYLILRALFYNIILGEPIYTYSLFSRFLHPSYSSFYMIFALSVLFLGGFQLSEVPRKDFMFQIASSSILVIAILFCSPKIALLTLAVTILFLCVYFIIKFKKLYYTLSFLLILSGISFVFVKIVPFPMERIGNFLEDYKTAKTMKYQSLEDLDIQVFAKGLNEKESTLARIFIWGTAWPVVKNHLFFGVGPGDVSTAMFNKAEIRGLYAFKYYNMHNQYLETQMGLGLLGTLLLLFLTIGPLIYSFIKRDPLLGMLSILVILYFCVESMLRMSYFTFFFPLFLYLFILSYRDKSEAAQNKE